MKRKRLQSTEYRVQKPNFLSALRPSRPALRATTNRRGFIFIMAYLMIVLFMVYELALLTYFAQHINAFERFSNNTIAYQLAEAGLDSAMAKLKNNQIDVTDGDYTETRNFTLGAYSVTVSTKHESGTDLQPGTFRITTLASAPAVSNPARPIQQATNVVAYVKKGLGFPFQQAIFGTEGISLNMNSLIDSYDGSYDPLAPGFNGDIGTDSTQEASIHLNKDAIIKGNAVVGPGGVPNEVISINEGAYITGTQSAAISPKNYQPATTNLPSEGELHFNTDTTYNFSAGTHRYDSIHFNTNAILTASGAVEIYVDGDFHVNKGSLTTVGNLPANFILYVGGDVTFNSDNVFYGAIYAPEGNVNFNSESDLFGSVIAKEYRNNKSGDVHFDEALKDVGGGGEEMTLVSWRIVPVEED